MEGKALILLYKFVPVHVNRGDDPPEIPFIPKLVGEYEDRATAKPLIGEGEFAIYESVGEPNENGMYESFKLDAPVVSVTAPATPNPTMRAKKKVSIGQ